MHRSTTRNAASVLYSFAIEASTRFAADCGMGSSAGHSSSIKCRSRIGATSCSAASKYSSISCGVPKKTMRPPFSSSSAFENI